MGASRRHKISGEFRGKFGRYIDALCSSVEPEKNKGEDRREADVGEHSPDKRSSHVAPAHVRPHP